jgi:PilZ domain
MYAAVVPSHVDPSETEILDGIGRAFATTLQRDGGLGFQLAAGVVVLALFVLLLRWVRREVLAERIARQVLDARHSAVMSQAGSDDEQREWVRVPAHLHMAVRHERSHHRPVYESCETENIGGGGLAFSTRTPPALRARIQFTLDLGERTSLPLRGIVVRVEPPAAVAAAHLVAVELGPITGAEREHIVRWVAHEETRELRAAHRGRLCVVCKRPLADGATERHSGCAEVAHEPPRLAAG